MSMSERKRKQKWSLNPRGNDWAQDSNKFGQKMLEKMGWQHGKGLGAKEDGITEHVKVSYKNDSKGMGFKESDDQWTEHETNFSALLESLSGEKPDSVKLNSLEKKSQSSRARVHYHKFTRGKDLSKYSEKDLANIFGKKLLKEQPKPEVKEEKSDDPEEKNEKESKFLFNAGSMRDYFKKKLPSFGKSNGYVVGHNGVLKTEESESETDARPRFSFKSNENDDDEVTYAGFGFKSDHYHETTLTNSKTTFVSYVNENSNEESIEKKSKKKRKSEEKHIDNVFSPTKKSRKNKDDSKKSVTESEGVSNPAFNPLRTPIKVQKHVLDTIEESISEDASDTEEIVSKESVITVQVHGNPQKKKKHLSEHSSNKMVIEEYGSEPKKTKVVENGLVNSVFIENDVVDLTMKGDKENEVENSRYEVKRKQSKKKKKKIEENECEIDVCNVDLTNDSIEENKQLYENPNATETVEEPSNDLQIEENPYETKMKKSKKKKKQRKVEIDLTNEDSVSSVSRDKTFALENPSFEDNLEESIDLTEIKENPYEVKIKKKKKKTKPSSNNFDSNASAEIFAQNEENPYEVKVKKEKKKGENYCIENPNFNDSLEETIPLEIEENPYEVKPKKKKKSENYAVENPNFNESIEETTQNEIKENPYEIKPKKKKKKNGNTLAIDNPNFNLNDSMETSENTSYDTEKKEMNEHEQDTPSNISLNIEESDLMLNVVTTPIIKRTEYVNGDGTYSVTRVKSVKRRKSVHFNDVTEERIIPNNDDLRNLTDIENRNELFEINTRVINKNLEEQNIGFDMSTLDNTRKKRKGGLDNAAFDKQRTNLEENLVSMSKTIDRYQAEIENDMNEKKLESLTMDDIMIGEVGNPHGEHEKLPEGTKLKFKYANFETRPNFYHLDKTGARKSYKHLIKGDITVAFKNTNLHEIQGYAIRAKTSQV